MLPEQIKNFREMVTLRDGTYVLLRPMVAEDETRLREFYAAVGDEDLRFFRHRVKDAALIHEWSEHLDYASVLPLLALVKDRVVGNVSLHFCEGPKRHMAEIRLFLAKDFRRRGLGTKMLRTLIDLARRQGLGILTRGDRRRRRQFGEGLRNAGLQAGSHAPRSASCFRTASRTIW